MFEITKSEIEILRTQIATSKPGRGGRRYRPYAFTEHGALMAASVLNTPRAVEVSVFVVRAFIRLREMLSTHADLAAKMTELECRLDGHDQQIGALLDAIRQLLAPPETPHRRIGFRAKE